MHLSDCFLGKIERFGGSINILDLKVPTSWQNNEVTVWAKCVRRTRIDVTHSVREAKDSGQCLGLHGDQRRVYELLRWWSTRVHRRRGRWLHHSSGVPGRRAKTSESGGNASDVDALALLIRLEIQIFECSNHVTLRYGTSVTSFSWNVQTMSYFVMAPSVTYVSWNVHTMSYFTKVPKVIYFSWVTVSRN